MWALCTSVIQLWIITSLPSLVQLLILLGPFAPFLCRHRNNPPMLDILGTNIETVPFLLSLQKLQTPNLSCVCITTLLSN